MISIHAPHTGRDHCYVPPKHMHLGISIHAPHTGRDLRPSVTAPGYIRISIHAPHTGRDMCMLGTSAQILNFNPRAPYGARLRRSVCIHTSSGFQSTRPIWGATPPLPPSDPPLDISIHAPHMGRDHVAFKWFYNTAPISIHAPHMGRDRCPAAPARSTHISIHAPHMGRDLIVFAVAFAL